MFDGHGAIHNHCNYNWAVDCGKRVYDDTPISSPGCLYQYGIYPVGEGCQTTFFKVGNMGGGAGIGRKRLWLIQLSDPLFLKSSSRSYFSQEHFLESSLFLHTVLLLSNIELSFCKNENRMFELTLYSI